MTILTLHQDLKKIAWAALILMLSAVLLGYLRAWWKERGQIEEIGERPSIWDRFDWRC